jgi:D-threo-aldose 1-dehydrogenase
LREEGVIRAWGLGVNRVEACEAALEHSDPDVLLLAGRYTLLDHSALDRLFPNCAARGVRVVVGGPFNSGLLAGGPHFDYVAPGAKQLQARDRIFALCQAHKVDIRAAALQFCAAHPVVCAVIPGAKSAEKLRQNAGFMRQRIPAAFWTDLKANGLIPPHAPTEWPASN